jgi:hypothetical protein
MTLVLHHALRAATSPVVFLLSMPVALWSPTAAELPWGLIPVVYLVLRRVLHPDF